MWIVACNATMASPLVQGVEIMSVAEMEERQRAKLAAAEDQLAAAPPDLVVRVDKVERQLGRIEEQLGEVLLALKGG